jgi:hypothetical protein
MTKGRATLPYKAVAGQKTFFSRRLVRLPLVSPVASGTIALPTLRIGKPPPARLGARAVRRRTGFRWYFPSCQNCSIKRSHWAHPVWTRRFLLSAGAPSRGSGMLRTSVIRHFDVTLRFATPDIRLASADAFAVVGGGCGGQGAPVQGQTGPSWQDGADVWILLTL